MTHSAISELPVVEPQRRAADKAPNAAKASRERTRAKPDFAQYRRRLRANVAPLTFGITIAIVLWIGWRNREDSGLTPDSGIGYWLGIVGGSLMVLLLVYPLRKRILSLRPLGTVTFWFRTHMIFGVLGPALILLHANFKLGSINSNMALVAMLAVATSGIIGRYLYSKIHLGLYGRKVVVREIVADADALKGLISAGLPVADHVVAQLTAFAQLGTTAPKSVLTGLFSLPVISLRARIVRARLLADVRKVIAVEGKRIGWSRKVRRRQLAGVSDLVTLHVAAVKKAAAFAFYERLFGLWHVFHLPLFCLLVIAAVIHVFAVHFF